MRRLFAVSLAALLSAGALQAQRLAPLAARLARYSLELDFAGGVAHAEAHARDLPRDARARAWYALLLARNDRVAAAAAVADSMRAAAPRSPWPVFARSAVLYYGYNADSVGPALAASDTVYRVLPRDEDVVWLRAVVLSGRDQAAAIRTVDSFLTRATSARMTVLRGNLTWSLSGASRTVNSAQRDSAIALWTRARQRDSALVAGWANAGARLVGAGRHEEGIALLARAVELAPESPGTNREYWSALRRVHVRDLAAARAAAAAGLRRVLESRGRDPAVLALLWREYEAFGMTDEHNAMEERILREHPASVAAEWVMVERYRRTGRLVADTTIRDAVLRARHRDEYRAQLTAFLARPVIHNPRLRGDAYRSLFHLADSTTHPDSLLAWIIGMERYEGINPHLVYAGGAIALADRGTHLDEAARLAREGVGAGRRKIENQRASYADIGEFARALDWMTAMMVNAQGWVHFRAGNLADARRDLLRSLDLDPRSMRTLFHLGRFHEAAGRLDSAEAYYIRGAMVAGLGINDNRAALRALYRRRTGSLEGYENYYATIRDRDRERRRTTVAAELRSRRDSLPPFALATLAGAGVRSDTLAGRVTVINFWGKWCGPCVAEMPELQRFWRQVAADTTVRMLTINNDGNLDELRQWMARHRYDMPVLVDSGYAARSNVHLYPTTWFLDRSGRIAFVKEGWSEELAEEFGWRVDLLRRESALP